MGYDSIFEKTGLEGKGMYAISRWNSNILFLSRNWKDRFLWEIVSKQLVPPGVKGWRARGSCDLSIKFEHLQFLKIEITIFLRNDPDNDPWGSKCRLFMKIKFWRLERLNQFFVLSSFFNMSTLHQKATECWILRIPSQTLKTIWSWSYLQYTSFKHIMYYQPCVPPF